MPDQEQYDIFISYSRRDKDFVEPIVQVLKERGLSVFFDRDIEVGQNWMAVLQAAMLSSRVAVIFITPDSLKSDWVQQELESALMLAANSDEKRYVISVLLRETNPGQLPLFLRLKQSLDRSQANLSDPEVRLEIGQSLADYIEKLVPGIGLPTLDMPFVVLAMTKQEANDLLNRPTTEPHFADLRDQLLANFTIEELLDSYVDTRDKWRSPLCRSEAGEKVAIQDTIEEVVKRINQTVLDESSSQNEEAVGRILRPKYFSAAFTSPDYSTRNQIYKELGRRGCVLIVDALSLFHPDLRKYLDGSGLAQPESKIVPIIAPLPYSRPTDPLDELLEQAMRQVMERPFFRYETELDILCEFGVSHPRALKRWLFFVLPLAAAAIQRQGASPDARRLLRGKLNG